MNETLRSLYDSFYTPPTLAEEKQEIKDGHRQLSEKLDKPERKLVLRIIDAKDHIAESLSIDSFVACFQLAWRLANELNIREKECPTLAERSAPGALDISEETEGGSET